MKYSRSELARRAVFMVAGALIMGLSIGISKLAMLGTTPISTIPAVMSYAFPDLTIGMWTIIINILLVAIEFGILGKAHFNPWIVFQLPIAILLGMFTDLGCELFKSVVTSDVYALQWFWNIFACFILSIGVFIIVTANLLIAPGDGIVVAMAMRIKLPFSRLKVIFDSSNVAIAAIISLALMGGFFGVREGTVFAAVAVGMFVGVWKKKFGDRLEALMVPAENRGKREAD